MRLTSLKKRLGDILVEAGVISPEQLDEALLIQKKDGGKLGAILSRMGVINEEVMLAFLGKQCGVSYVALSEYGDIPDYIIHTIREYVIRYQKLIPIAKEGNVITVAMADPFNIFALDDIKLMTGYDIQVVIASEAEIRGTIDRYFNQDTAQPAPDGESDDTAPSGDAELLDTFLTQALRMNVSMMYLEPQVDRTRFRCRINGLLCEKQGMSRTVGQRVVFALKARAGLDTAVDRLPQEGRFSFSFDRRELIVHCSIVPSVFGERAVLKITDLASLCIDINKIGFEPEALALYRKYIESPRGLILVCGPVASGKTTTLYSTLSWLNYPDRDILTLEDPVECAYPGLTQMTFNSHDMQFDPSVILRQNPDVLMLGEIREERLAHFAVDAAAAGHLVLASVPAPNAGEAIAMITTMGVNPLLLAATLKLVVTQNLMRMVCTECRESYDVAAGALKSLGINLNVTEPGEKSTLWRGLGCRRCSQTGYYGRTGVFELVEMTDLLKRMISERAPAVLIQDMISRGNILSLHDAAWKKVQFGISSAEEMMRLMKI